MANAVKRGAHFGLDWMLLTAGILMFSSAILGSLTTPASNPSFETSSDLFVYDEKLPI